MTDGARLTIVPFVANSSPDVSCCISSSLAGSWWKVPPVR